MRRLTTIQNIAAFRRTTTKEVMLDLGENDRNGGGPKSHIPAHAATTTVAPFRAWRGLQFSVAGGPKGPP